MVVLDLMRDDKTIGTLASALAQRFTEFHTQSTLPPIYEVYTDWTYAAQWSDVKDPILLPTSGMCDPPMNGHASIATQLKARRPEAVPLIAPHFFSALEDKDLPQLGLNVFKTAESARRLAVKDLQNLLKAAPGTSIILYDPTVEQRTGLTAAQRQKMLATRAGAFAKEIGADAGRIAIVTTPDQVAEHLQARGRAIA